MSIVKGDVAATTGAGPDGPAGSDGRRTRWDAHRTARRAHLIESTIRSIARHGPDVGMDQIAADAGTSKPVVYRYFADKTDLYRAVTQRVVSTVMASLQAATAESPSSRQVIHASVDAYLALLEQSPQLFRFVLAHPHLERAADGSETATFSEVIAELLGTELGQTMRAGGLDPAFAHPWGEAIVGFISAASLWWIDHPGGMQREHLTDYLAALLWGGAAGVQLFAGEQVDPRPAAGVFPALPE